MLVQKLSIEDRFGKGTIDGIEKSLVDERPGIAATKPTPLLQRSTVARPAERCRLRDDLAAARQRYEDAVFAARTAGFSWTEIGRLLGVSRQQVHRQFRAL